MKPPLRQPRQVSLSVLEVRLKRSVRPKDRLWAVNRLAKKLTGITAAQTERALRLFTEAEQMAEIIHNQRGVAAAIQGAGSCYLRLSNLPAALDSLKRALPIAEQTGYAECEIKILRDMGVVYTRQSHHDLALITLQKCVELAELTGNRRIQASALDQMGRVLMNPGRYQEALECQTKSLTLIEGTGWTHEQVMALLHMSNALRRLGRYAEALSTLERASQLCRASQDIRFEGICQGAMGLIYSDIGDYSNALILLLASAKILDSTGDKLNLANTFGNLMYVYLLSDNPEAAIDLGHKALAIFEAIGDKNGQAEILGNIGKCYLDQGEKEKARRLLNKCLSFSREIGLKSNETTMLLTLANLGVKFGSCTSAEKLYLGALAITNKSGDLNNTADVLLGLGELFNKQSYPDRAIPLLNRAVTIAEEIHSRRHEQKSHQMLAEAFEATGDLGQALTHWKLASSIREEILGVEKQKAITAIQIRAATEKLEKEKVHLSKEKKLKSQEVEQMAMELTEKVELIRTTSRRLKTIIQPLPVRDGRATRSQLEGLLSDLNHSLGERRTVPSEFQLVHRSTLRRLSKTYPALSHTECKICVLLRDGLSTKQMADMLKVTARTIDNHRYKIRKKMKLEREASLSTTLAGM